MFSKLILAGVLVSILPAASAIAEAVESPEIPDGSEYYDGSSGSDDTMAFTYVSSVGVDSFLWYRNDSIGGDTFDIDSMSTNVSAPFQIAVQVEGSWDFTVHSATAIYVYTAGSGTAAVSAGTLTLGDGYHVLYNDTSAGGS
ncbi:MAG TPA: hypothetical protein DEO92_09435, partial [Phycisphaerales bacterium]|nr:hypothetical protein [Phycisphaerales bacterium]